MNTDLLTQAEQAERELTNLTELAALAPKLRAQRDAEQRAARVEAVKQEARTLAAQANAARVATTAEARTRYDAILALSEELITLLEPAYRGQQTAGANLERVIGKMYLDREWLNCGGRDPAMQWYPEFDGPTFASRLAGLIEQEIDRRAAANRK